MCRGSLRTYGGAGMQRKPMLREENPHRDEDCKREQQRRRPNATAPCGKVLRAVRVRHFGACYRSATISLRPQQCSWLTVPNRGDCSSAMAGNKTEQKLHNDECWARSSENDRASALKARSGHGGKERHRVGGTPRRHSHSAWPRVSPSRFNSIRRRSTNCQPPD